MSPFARHFGFDIQFGWLLSSEGRIGFQNYRSIQIGKFVVLWRLS
jgi:hypothetical protein